MPNLDGWYFVLAPARWKHTAGAWWVVCGFALEEDALEYMEREDCEGSGRKVATFEECMELGNSCEW